MTDDKITLRALLEKGSDATFLREMIGFAAERLMQRETGELCGAMGHRGEQCLVQPLVPQPAVEAPGEGVLRRLARRDALPHHPLLLRPTQDHRRRQLRAVVAHHRKWLAPQADQGGQLSRHLRS